MRVLSQNIGIDVAQDSFVAFYGLFLADMSFKKIGQRKFSNMPAGFKAFHLWLGKLNSHPDVLTRIVMEATGRYHESLAYYLYDLHYRVSIVLPNRIKYFSRSGNNFSKTDPIDAQLISQYGALYSPQVWQPASKLMRQLRELSRERQDIIQMRTQVRNRIHALRSSAKPHLPTQQRLEKQVKFFNTQIKQIEEEMIGLQQLDECLGKQVKLLISIPSIGLITACIILAETNGFVLFENRNQLIKYAGLDVIEKQSGSSINGRSRISKRGNSNLRAALFMPALTAARIEGVFQKTYNRQLQRGKCKSKALMAVQRQLLLVVFGIHQKQQVYDARIHSLRMGKGVGQPMASLQ